MNPGCRRASVAGLFRCFSLVTAYLKLVATIMWLPSILWKQAD